MMMRAIPAIWPDGAATARRIGKLMDVTLHLGAHRCATTSFQNYLRLNNGALMARGVGFWGPRRTRNGLFRGVLPVLGVASCGDQQRRGTGRVRMHLARSAGLGLRTLLVSDENMLGTMRENLRLGDLYCGVGERMARYGEAFDGQIATVALNIRSLDSYWMSVLGFCLARGRGLPGSALLERLAASPRSWRDVVSDLARALPGVQIRVLPFETYAGHPGAQLGAIDRIKAPDAHDRDWLNPTPRLPQLRALETELSENWCLPEGEGRWNPFSPAQAAMMQETYADDMMWLAGGADGLARLMPDADKKQTGKNPRKPDMTRGRNDDRQERRMARAR